MTMALPAGLLQRFPAIIGKKQAAIEYGPVGIDFDAAAIRLVQFRKNDGVVELSASAVIPLSDDVRRFGKTDTCVDQESITQAQLCRSRSRHLPAAKRRKNHHDQLPAPGG